MKEDEFDEYGDFGDMGDFNDHEFDFTEQLDCGCEKEIVNGKVVWYLCDEHDDESHCDQAPPPLKKYRKKAMDNE